MKLHQLTEVWVLVRDGEVYSRHNPSMWLTRDAAERDAKIIREAECSAGWRPVKLTVSKDATP